MGKNVRNRDGLWINANVFREEALHYEKYGYYCPYAWGSNGWIKYWQEQKRRCIEGYEVSGSKITGYHYFYLNFNKIKAIDYKTKKKVYRFPDFWDGDYNYFWALDIAEKGIKLKEYKKLRLDLKIKEEDLKGNKHLLLAKARRKGYSYKNAAIAACDYHTRKNSTTIIGSFDKKYAKDTYDKAYESINFIDSNTGFRKQRLSDKKSEYIRSGYIDTTTGINIAKGYLSEIVALTFMDNPDAARGKDANKVILEEMGTFPNAIDAFAAIEPSVKDGDIKTGIMIMYGTSSNKQSMTAPFKEMFYNPEIYDILAVENIWDESADGTYSGIFIPVYLNKPNYYDKKGNSDIKGAIESEKKEREKRKINSTALNNYITEYPFSPSEAFRSGNINIFPIDELQRQLKIVLTNKLYITKGQPVKLYYKDGIVRAKPILDLKTVEPIYFYKQKINNISGVPIIYEYPVENSPQGLYKIGYDPYAQDQSKSESLAAIYVYKTIEVNSYSRNMIVAQYVGRPPEADDANKIALMLAELYNTEVMHENMFLHVKNYFRNKKKLNRLAAQPDRVISKNIKHSSVSRIFGMHMNEQLKDAGEKYIKDWLTEVRDFDENNSPIFNIDFIYDAGLLEELINYNRKGNFDRVMALMQVMFQVQENIEQKYNNKEKISIFEEVNNYLNYKKYGL